MRNADGISRKIWDAARPCAHITGNHVILRCIHMNYPHIWAHVILWNWTKHAHAFHFKYHPGRKYFSDEIITKISISVPKITVNYILARAYNWVIHQLTFYADQKENDKISFHTIHFCISMPSVDVPNAERNRHALMQMWIIIIIFV